MNWTRAGALAGLAGAVVVTVGWIVGGLAQGGGYDWASQEISDLGALTARHAWVWNLADSLFGVLTCVFAAGLLGLVGGSRAGRIGAALIGVVGVGSVIDGLLREDCPLSTSKACQRLQNGPGLSWHQYAHDVESVIVAAATVAAPLVLARVFRAAGGPDSLRTWSLGAGVAIALSYAVYVGRYGDPGGGIAQRLALTAFLLWIAVVSIWMLRSAGARSAPR
jgi:hypothetical protein